MKAPTGSPRSLRSALAAVALLASVGCTPTMDNSSRGQLLTPTTPKDFQMTAQDVYPISAAALDYVRTTTAPLVCDAKGPADDAAKKLLTAVSKAVSKLDKSRKNPCAQGEGRAQIDASGASLCLNSTTKETATTKLSVSCEAGKITIAMDSGTFEVEKLHGTIWKYSNSEIVTLLGWNADKTRAIVVKSSLLNPERSDHMSGSFLVIHLPYFADAAAREMIPTIRDFTDFELFMVDAGKKGYVVRAPRDEWFPAEIETAGFLVE